MRNLEEHTGYWWTPDDPEHQFPGRLITEDDKAHLYMTIDSKTPFSLKNGVHDYDVIHGRTSSGKLISLLNCFDLSVSLTSGGLESRNILVNFVLIGGLVPPRSSGKGQFKELHLSWPLLRTWFWHSGVTVKWDKQNQQNYWDFSIEFKHREPIEITCSDGLKISFAFGTDSLPMGGVFSEQISFKEIVWVSATPASPQNIEYFLALLNELQDFFSICMLDYCTPDNVSVVSAFDTDVKDDSRILPQYLDVHLSSALRSKSSSMPHPINILLPYQGVGANLQTMIDRWHEMAPDLTPVRSLYFSSLYRPNRYVESTFLSLAQAIEVFHRRRKGGTYLEDKVFKERVAARLISALPEELDGRIKQVFSQKIEFMNEYSLAKRITEIAEAHSGVVATYIPDLEHAVRSIVEARNYYTHYSEDRKNRKPSIQNLVDHQGLIRMLIELAILSEVGAEATELHSRALSCQKYRGMFSRQAQT